MEIDIFNPKCDVKEVFRVFMKRYTNIWEPWFLDEHVSEFLEAKRTVSENTKCMINAWLQIGLIEKNTLRRIAWTDRRCWFITEKGETLRGTRSR